MKILMMMRTRKLIMEIQLNNSRFYFKVNILFLIIIQFILLWLQL
jgi:hypothetical protein